MAARPESVRSSSASYSQLCRVEEPIGRKYYKLHLISEYTGILRSLSGYAHTGQPQTFQICMALLRTGVDHSSRSGRGKT